MKLGKLIGSSVLIVLAWGTFWVLSGPSDRIFMLAATATIGMIVGIIGVIVSLP